MVALETAAPLSLVVKECLLGCLKPKIIQRTLHHFQMWGRPTGAQPAHAWGWPPKMIELGGISGSKQHTKKRCCNELLAKWREVPSLITVNIAVSVAAEQERQRQDGCAGPEAACSSVSPSAAIFGLMALSSSL